MSALVFNPRARLTLARRAGAPSIIRVAAPVRGQPLREDTVEGAREPEVVNLLERIAGGGAVDMQLSDAARARLEELRLLVCEDDVPPPVRFGPACFAGRSQHVIDRTRLFVNPTLTARELSAAPFARNCTWLEAQHAVAALPVLAAFDASDGAALAQLVPGEPPPVDLAPERVDALAAAGILVDAAHDEQLRVHRAERAAHGRTLEAERYVVVRSMLHPIERAAIARYYRTLIAEGYIALGDSQVSRRYVAHNEPLARSLHRRLAPLISELAGEPMKPSYCYLASYRGGAVLAPHRDRAECELSISLQLDYEPGDHGVSPWPLYVESRRAGGFAAAHLAPGDGLVYRGCELTHYRDELAAGHASTSVFMHYVPEAFEGSLD